MARFIVLNTHSGEECESMEEGTLSEALKGQNFYCTCPAGEHAYYMFLEGDSAEEVLGLIPTNLKLGKTRAVGVEVWQL